MDSGPKKKTKKNEDGRSGKPGDKSPKIDRDKDRELPLCLWEPHRKAGARHLLRYCKKFPTEEKNVFVSKSLPRKPEQGHQSPPAHNLPNDLNLKN